MVTQAEAEELLNYDPVSGIFKWKSDRERGAKAGSEAGCLCAKGYRRIWIKGHNYYSHRLAWLLIYGEFPNNETDHINGITGDNRIVNLRSVSTQENQRNAKLRRDNSSGIVGVRWRDDTRKWAAEIKVNGKQMRIAQFDALLDAVCARRAAEIEYGYHKNHGRKEPPE